MTKDEAIDKAMDIIADHRWDDSDNNLMVDMGRLIEEIYEEEKEWVRNNYRRKTRVTEHEMGG